MEPAAGRASNPVFVLIHSPLVGPFTWALVAERLRQRGWAAVVPDLRSDPDGEKPYWQQHARAVAQALEDSPADQPPILVAHSGAGPLLPAVRELIRRPVASYVFVDAGLPENGQSRLDQFGDRKEVEAFRQSARAEFLPTWSETDLTTVIPDDRIRAQFVRELRPLPLAVYEEPLPVSPGWPDAPCAYLRFGDNPAYDPAYGYAQRADWPSMRLEGQHFHMLVAPEEVTRAILALVRQQDKSTVSRPDPSSGEKRKR